MSKTQKLVVISDTHVHPWKAFGNGTGFNNVRLQQTLYVIDQSLALAQEEDAIWIHGGDWIHTTGYVEHPASSAIIDLLSGFPKIPKVTTFGNHDARTQGGKITKEETFLYALEKAVPNLFVLDNSAYDQGGLTIRGWGAQNDIALIEEAADPADIGLFHQMVSSAKFPSGMVTDHGMDPDFLRSNFHLSILGDIHHPHLDIDEFGNAILIPGSPEHHNFGDKGERGYWLVTMEETTDGWYPVDFESVESGSPKFLTVDDPFEVKDDGNYYRVLGGSGEDVPDNAVAIKPSPTVVETRDLLEGAQNREDILRRWTELNPPEEEDTLAVGLKILKQYDQTVPRKAQVKRVEGENFFSYKKLEYDVNEGIHLLVGKSASYDSNGAGKSSAMEAIFWALFGKTTKGVSAADVIRWGADKAWVRVYIELEGKELIVTRSRTKTSISLEVTFDGEEITGFTNTELSSRLEGMLGLTPDLFKALGYFSQEDLVLLSRATDGELKEIFADIRGLGAYQQAAAEAGEVMREEEKNVDALDAKIETLEEEIKRDKVSLASIEAKEKKWSKQYMLDLKVAKEDVTQYKTFLHNVKKEKEERLDSILARAETLLEQADSHRDEIFLGKKKQEIKKKSAELKTEIAQVQDQLDSLEEELGDQKDVSLNEALELEESLEAGVEVLKGEISDIKADKSRISFKLENQKEKKDALQKKIENLDTETSTCPTCGQDIGSEDAYNHAVDHIQKDIDAVNEVIDELLKEFQNIKDIGPIEEELEKVKRNKKKTSELVAKLREYRTKKDRLSGLHDKLSSAKEVAEARAERHADQWLNNRKNRIKSRVQKASQILDKKESKAEQNLKDAERGLETLEDKENPHTSHKTETSRLLEERTDTLESAEAGRREAQRMYEIYKYWYNGFGKSGLQSLLIEDFVSLFNKHRGTIFPILTRGKYDVQMSAISTTQSGDEREKAEYRVFQDGKEVDYNALSGGQRRRVDLGVLLTTTLAASKAHGIPGALGILILDEVASYLDSDGAEALAETLQEYCPNVVPSVYVVSQDMSHKALYDDVIMVEQNDNGISRIVS